MHRVISYLCAAIVAFIVGLASHGGIETLGGFAIDKLYDIASPAELKAATVLPESESTSPLAHTCGHLVVSVSDDDSLYLNRELAGTLDDPAALSAMLRTIFELRQELHVYRPAPDISATVPLERRTEKTVYIKAPRSVSYGKVADLIEAIKDSGADPIGLIADRRIRSTN
jgi:biopolymer transport protein ExbD